MRPSTNHSTVIPVVDHGEDDPSSSEGLHVLTHELTHVRQQTGGAVSMLPQEDLALEIDPDPALEREVEETTQRVMQGGELGIQRLADTDVHVQRIDANEMFPALAMFKIGRHRTIHTVMDFIEEIPEYASR